jgi:hypothetical protein
MSKTEILGAINYSAHFTGADAADTHYVINLTRASDTSAPNSNVTLPAPFTIAAPTSAASFSRASDSITVSWSAAGSSDKMALAVSGGCINEYDQVLTGDSGTATISSGSLKNLVDGSQNCQVTLKLSRQRSGTLDPAYGYGGSIVAAQVRSVTFQSTP